MVQVAERCPDCGEAMARHRLWDLVDCLARRPDVVDPLEAQLARLWADLERLERLDDLPDRSPDHVHHWVTIERMRLTSVQECTSCADWRTARPPAAGP